MSIYCIRFSVSWILSQRLTLFKTFLSRQVGYANFVGSVFSTRFSVSGSGDFFCESSIRVSLFLGPEAVFFRHLGAWLKRITFTCSFTA